MVITAILSGLMGSCASPPDAAPGINAREMQALERTYDWKSGYEPPEWTDAELAALMDRSSDLELDGEYAESQTSSIALALATVGDDRFFSILSTRTPEVQHAVIDDIRYLRSHYGLSYPQTESFADSLRGNGGNRPQPPSHP